MLVRFWGTRGSIPVALTSTDIRDKIVQALLAASGRSFASTEEACTFTREELPFSVNKTFGGHTPCVWNLISAVTSITSATWAAARVRSVRTCWPDSMADRQR